MDNSPNNFTATSTNYTSTTTSNATTSTNTTTITTTLRERYEVTVKQMGSLYKDMDESMKQLEKREKEVEKREQEWAATVALMEKHASNAKQRIILDVGGTRFTTTRTTLMSVPNSFFHAMLSSPCWQPDPDGSYFIDRSPKYFGYVLDMLRNGQIDFSGIRTEKVAKIHVELDFYQLFSRVPTSPASTFKPIGSNLLSLELQKQLMAWLGENRSCELIYQSSRDGLNPEVFHRMCDDKGPTVTVYQGRGFLFGGYTQVSWNQSGGTVRDPFAFLFTLSNPHHVPPCKYPAKHRGMPVFLHSRCLPILGVYMAINPLPNYQVRIVLHAFPGDVVDTTGKGCYIFTGTEEFNIDDVEVFVVK